MYSILYVLIDIDECASNPCQHVYATCTDALNGYTCTCPSDFTGTHCEIGKKFNDYNNLPLSVS